LHVWHWRRVSDDAAADLSGNAAAIAIATVTAQIAASSMTGALSHWQKRKFDRKLTGFLVVGGLAGKGLGVLAFNWGGSNCDVRMVVLDPVMGPLWGLCHQSDQTMLRAINPYLG
jgi:hypothetical protein